jgi:hypothetical protein
MDEFHCSFCGKARREVRKLIAGPRVFICDECVGLCVHIVNEEPREDAPPREAPAPYLEGKVILGDWSAICLDALDCRIIWPVVGGWEKLCTRLGSGLRELLPELYENPETTATFIEVRDFGRACACMSASGFFAGNPEIREAGATRVAVFRSPEGKLAALVAA